MANDELLDFVGIGNDELRAWRRIGLRKSNDETVVAPHRLHVDGQLAADLRSRGHRLRRMNFSAERREHDDTPIAELIEHALDDDRSIVGYRAGCLLLIL